MRRRESDFFSFMRHLLTKSFAATLAANWASSLQEVESVCVNGVQ